MESITSNPSSATEKKAESQNATGSKVAKKTKKSPVVAQIEKAIGFNTSLASSPNLDEVYNAIKETLENESASDWERARLFFLANDKHQIPYRDLSNKAVAWGYRKYTFSYIHAIATTAAFFGTTIAKGKPFSWHQEVRRAIASLENAVVDAHCGMTTPTPAEAIDAVGSAVTRSDIFEKLRAKFAPKLAQKPAVKHYKLFTLVDGTARKGYRFVIIAENAAKARESYRDDEQREAIENDMRRIVGEHFEPFDWGKATAEPLEFTTGTEVAMVLIGKKAEPPKAADVAKSAAQVSKAEITEVL